MTAPLTQANVESEALLARLRALAGSLEPYARPAIADAGALGADLQPALAALTDRLLERVALLTAAIQKGEAALDEIDALTARVLLADLSLVASAWRALQSAASGRLDAAARDLEEAAALLARTLNEPED